MSRPMSILLDLNFFWVLGLNLFVFYRRIRIPIKKFRSQLSRRSLQFLPQSPQFRVDHIRSYLHLLNLQLLSIPGRKTWPLQLVGSRSLTSLIKRDRLHYPIICQSTQPLQENRTNQATQLSGSLKFQEVVLVFQRHPRVASLL